jgi:hypothetical protein
MHTSLIFTINRECLIQKLHKLCEFETKLHPANNNQSNLMGNLKMDWSERG